MITKDRFSHHTSYIWEFKDDMDCLLMPEKQPEYRQNRPHKNFLIGMNQVMKGKIKSVDHFFDLIKKSAIEEFLNVKEYLAPNDFDEILIKFLANSDDYSNFDIIWKDFFDIIKIDKVKKTDFVSKRLIF